MLQIDYLQQTIDNISTRKKTVDRIDWLYLHTLPLQNNNVRFDEDYSVYKFLALHTGQTLSLTHLLNTLLAPHSPIYITDGETIVDTFIFIDTETFKEDVFIYKDSETIDETDKVWLYTDTELLSGEVDFFVNISELDSGLTNKINSLVNLYKAAGKKYEIIEY